MRLRYSFVDDGANLVYLGRMDDTQIGRIEVSIQKARTAISFKRPSKAFEDMVAGGRTAVLGLPAVVPIEGGLPLIVDRQIVGAIGVSGATSQQDGVVAKAGAGALQVTRLFSPRQAHRGRSVGILCSRP